MGFQGRKVLLISPEPWSGVQINKHVLAHALVRRGCRVCFWGPPERDAKGVTLTRDKGVDLVHYAHWFRGVNHLPRFVRDRYYGRFIRRIEQLAGGRFDTIWCFDTTRMQEFPRGDVRRILHLVDYDTLDTGDNLIRTADLVLTVAEPISEHVRRVWPDAPVHCVGHVLDERWLEGEVLLRIRRPAHRGLCRPPTDRLRGLGDVLRHSAAASGDPLRPLRPLRSRFPGPGFQAIRRATNVTFHGLLSKEDLIPRIRRADILFFCYRAYRLKAIASNHHKVLEYLSTGNPIVGSHVSAYDGTSLFLMAGEREAFIPLFTRACQEYVALNAPALREARMRHAGERTMPALLDRVDTLLQERA